MSLKDDVEGTIASVLSSPWKLRVGEGVPATESVALAGGAVELDSTVLYADMVESTTLITEQDRRVAAKVIKAFLGAACRVINAHDGTVTSFDGDRVMAVFVGKSKNTSAAKSALKINHVVRNVLVPKLKAHFESLSRTGFNVTHCTGVDTGVSIGVRAGVRGSNDLVWIGRAPYLAAGLSDIRDAPYYTFITDAVFRNMADEVKYGGDPKQLMWEERVWTKGSEKLTVHRSSWTWNI